MIIIIYILIDAFTSLLKIIFFFFIFIFYQLLIIPLLIRLFSVETIKNLSLIATIVCNRSVMKKFFEIFANLIYYS